MADRAAARTAPAGPGWPTHGPERVDPWRPPEWRVPKAGLPYALMLLALFVLAGFAAPAAAEVVDEARRARAERSDYVEVQGRTVAWPGPGTPVDFVGTGGAWGEVTVPLPGSAVAPETPLTLLVARDDPADYVLPGGRARPAAALRGLLLPLAAGAALAFAAAVLARRRPVDLRDVAAAGATGAGPDDATAPPPLGDVGDVGAVWRDALLAAVLALPLFAAAGLGTARALDERTVRTLTADAVATTLSGRYLLAFTDARGEQRSRPLTGAELAGDPAPGDVRRVTYRLHPIAEAAWRPVAFGALAAVAGLAVLGRALTWPLALRRAAARPPVRADLVTWARRPTRTDWLLTAPAKADSVAGVVAIRLRPGVVPPVALAGPVWVHGTLRRGRAAIVRGADGTPYWPARRSGGWFAAAWARVGPVAPVRDGQPGA